MTQRSCGSLHAFLFPCCMVPISLPAKVSTLHDSSHELVGIPLVATVIYKEVVKPIQSKIPPHHSEHGSECFHIADTVQGSHQPSDIYFVPISSQEHYQVQGLAQANALHEQMIKPMLRCPASQNCSVCQHPPCPSSHAAPALSPPPPAGNPSSEHRSPRRPLSLQTVRDNVSPQPVP